VHVFSALGTRKGTEDGKNTHWITPDGKTDLNPLAARVATTPETSDYTSIKQRVDSVEPEGKTVQLEEANGGSVAGSEAAVGLVVFRGGVQSKTVVGW
jgi:hypothetical protein